jgi:hypothetical protein
MRSAWNWLDGGARFAPRAYEVMVVGRSGGSAARRVLVP